MYSGREFYVAYCTGKVEKSVCAGVTFPEAFRARNDKGLGLNSLERSRGGCGEGLPAEVQRVKLGGRGGPLPGLTRTVRKCLV